MIWNDMDIPINPIIRYTHSIYIYIRIINRIISIYIYIITILNIHVIIIYYKKKKHTLSLYLYIHIPIYIIIFVQHPTNYSHFVP